MRGSAASSAQACGTSAILRIVGAGKHRRFDVMVAVPHIFEGLTLRDIDVAIFAGMKDGLNAVGLTVKNFRFERIGFGVWTGYAGSTDFCFADNVILGRLQGA